MAVSVKVRSISRDVEVLLNGLSPQARGKAFAQVARQGLQDAERQNAKVLGAVPPHTTAVDNQSADDSDLERAQNTIAFEFQILGDVVKWISEQLMQASPNSSGRYRRSHIVFADGKAVEPDDAPLAKEYVFLNEQPYARKIEPSGAWAQKHGRALSGQAPDGVYEKVAAQARAKFGNLANIRFGYVAPTSGAIVEFAKGRAGRKGRKMNAAKALAYNSRQPAITVRINGL